MQTFDALPISRDDSRTTRIDTTENPFDARGETGFTSILRFEKSLDSLHQSQLDLRLVQTNHFKRNFNRAFNF